ncbi:MAG: phosphoribosylanthranilate isomerase [Eubacteriales bacterium]
MAKVKICGIKSRDDIDIVNALLPDYIGFVFCPTSKRYISLNEAKVLSSLLSSKIKKVGVFVNEKKETINKLKEECNLDVLQLHGDEKPQDCFYDGASVWKAIRIKDSIDLDKVKFYNVDRFLLDTFVLGSYGGSGKMFDLNLIRYLSKKDEIVLAGGLSPENVKTIVKTVNPYAVDVSSGVETEGKKDYCLVKEFIDKVRNCHA